MNTSDIESYFNQILLFKFIFLSPTSTKPVGLKIVKLDIVLMVELTVLLV